MRKLDLSELARLDRIIGFTIPRNESFYVCSHDAVWKVAIGIVPSFEVTEHRPYRFAEQSGDFLGLVFNGLVANSALMCVGESQISYDFDPKKEFVTLNYKVGSRSGQIEFETLSEDWFSASLSDDGRHLVLAEPYDIAVYEVG
jgi:hypothetical protein